MDIPVSRLNERVALQLPPELPLGLVFVVGKVERFKPPSQGDGPGTFQLVEKGYHLRCLLSERASDGFKEGDLIRAGGHLSFEPVQAAYYLVARDIEVLEEYRPPSSALSEIMADSTERSRDLGLAPAELPEWVKELAPPELREGMEFADKSGQSQAEEGVWPTLAGVEAEMAYPADEPALAELSDEVISFLSEAMDSPEDVELTAQLINELTQPKPVTEPEPDDEVLTPDDQVDYQSEAPISEDQRLVEDTLPTSADKPVEDGVVEEDVKSGAEEGELIPWYVIVLALFLFLLFVGTLAIVIRFFG